MFRSSLGQHRQIIEYQVQQTQRGAEIRVITDAPLDTVGAAMMIEEALAAAGLEQAEVTITQVAVLGRQVSAN
jgi:uncharacterized protein YpuA (DUF1002 family)